MMQVCFPGHSDVGSSGPYNPYPGATKLYISSNTRANLPIVQFGHHPTVSACPLSPIILLAKHSRRRARLTASRYPSTQSSEHPPPNLQMPSPPVCSTGSQDANSALISCTMHTPCLMAHRPSKVRAFEFFVC